MSAEQTHWYRSKVDWWAGLILVGMPAMTLAVSVIMALDGNTSGMLVGLGSVLFVLCLYIGVIFPMRYGLNDTHLVVRFGLCHPRIPLAEIKEVTPTRNPLSSPALSLDRLWVQCGTGDAVMISPAERNRFLDDLAEKAGLKREGNRLVRA
jgi:hypothetical protein